MTKGNPNLPEHLPYEEEARMLSDVIEFFIHRLPHAIGATVDHIDEAALSTELMHRLEVMSDDDLKGMGLHRSDISKISASLAGLFKVAHKAASNRP